MKKGFTLAELLAVLVVLGIISAITIPIVTTQLSNYKKDLCKTQYQNILTAARVYGSDNIMTLKDGDTITLGILKQKGYIDSDEIKNPVTKEEISDDLTITINNVGTNTVKFKYTLENSIDSYCE